MKKAIKTLSSLIIAAALTQACSSSPEAPSAEKPEQPAAQAEKNPAPVTTTSASVTSAPQPAATPTGPQPELFVPVKKIDFGTQPGGKKIERTITVKNVGNAELKIESVVPSCGCTTASFPHSLMPGKAGKIKVALEIAKSPGSHTKSVTIKSNDPAQPSVQVDLAFNVK